jgi:hypothetical protein
MSVRAKPTDVQLAARAARKWTRAQIVAAIRDYVATHGDIPPTLNDWQHLPGSAERGKHPSNSTVIRAFGSWSAAIRAAGFEPNRPGGSSEWTRQLVVAAIKEYARVNGGLPPTADAWRRGNGRPGEPGAHPGWRTVRQLFGSWGEALRAAGFTPRHGRPRAPAGVCAGWTRELAIAAIRRYAAAHDGWPPTAVRWQRAGDQPLVSARGRVTLTDQAYPSATVVRQLFGSWAGGIRAAGFEPRAINLTWTHERVIAALRAYAAANDGLPPKRSDWARAVRTDSSIAHPTAALVVRLFGSFAAAVEAAGFEPRRVLRGPKRSKWTHEQVIGGIHDYVASNGGRPPSVREWRRTGRQPGRTVIERLFGSWGEALRAAGFEPDRGQRRQAIGAAR